MKCGLQTKPSEFITEVSIRDNCIYCCIAENQIKCKSISNLTKNSNNTQAALTKEN